MKRTAILLAVSLMSFASVNAQPQIIRGYRGGTTTIVSPSDRGAGMYRDRGGAIVRRGEGITTVIEPEAFLGPRMCWATAENPILEVGLNTLTGISYPRSGYDDFMNFDMGRSYRFKLNLANGGMRLSRDAMLTSMVSLIWSNYTFTDSSTRIGWEDGWLVPVKNPSGISRSKFTTFAFRVPIMLTAHMSPEFFLSAGLYAEVVTRGHDKIKLPKEKFDVANVNPVQTGIIVRMGINRTLSVYGEYGFSRMFDSDKAPIAHPISFGIGVGLF